MPRYRCTRTHIQDIGPGRGSDFQVLFSFDHDLLLILDIQLSDRKFVLVGSLVLSTAYIRPFTQIIYYVHLLALKCLRYSKYLIFIFVFLHVYAFEEELNDNFWIKLFFLENVLYS